MLLHISIIAEVYNGIGLATGHSPIHLFSVFPSTKLVGQAAPLDQVFLHLHDFHLGGDGKKKKTKRNTSPRIAPSAET